MAKIAITLLIAALSGCSSFPVLRSPQTIGERSSGYTYIPLDPLPVQTRPGRTCRYDEATGGLAKGYKYKDLLDALPDNAVRMAIKEYDAKGKLSFGASSLGVEGRRYQVILDYINVDSTNIRFYIKVKGDEILEVTRVDEADFPSAKARTNLTPEAIEKLTGNIVIPVYVGVGLRLTADLQVVRGSLNLSSLGAIAAGVESGRASGSLVVQTIGVTGKQVSTSLPMPSELNQTTVQNAILALGSIKAVIYDGKNTTITPRITGIYLPMRAGTEELVNRIVSELARDEVFWIIPCIRPDGLS